MKALMNFTFPDVADEVWKEQLEKRILFVIFNVILYTNLFKSIRKSSDGLTTSGFEKLAGEYFMFISNHRDILLDHRY
jgi:hypothetical protein